MLDQELDKPAIKKIQKRKVYITFKENICEAELAEVGPLSSINPGVKYLLGVSIRYHISRFHQTRNSYSYLGYLDKLVYEFTNTYHRFIFKNCSALTEEFGTTSKAPQFKVYEWVRITKYGSISSKYWSKEISVIIL